jgi:glyoxylase-like metal-dependent hydrolase (beta-lactamase superfamily II)
MPVRPEIKAFYEPVTHTISYVLRDPTTLACAIVDPVLDYEARSGRIFTESAAAIAEHVREQGLTVQWILETHAHADHLSAAQWLRKHLGGRVAIGRHITKVQARFAALFGFPPEFAADGSQFDHLFADHEVFHVGNLAVQVLETPGHTPACVSYHAGNDAVFVGDTLFMPDYGTARADFPGGDAHALYRSIQRILRLPPRTRLFMCHDYRPGGREARWETTVEEERALNGWVRDGVGEAEFVARRRTRDRELDVPELILPALQVNIRAGHLPDPQANGIRYLKIPLDQLGRRA